MMLLRDEQIQNQHQENELAKVMTFPTRKSEISERIMAKFAPRQSSDSQYPQTISCPICNRAILLTDEDTPREFDCNCAEKVIADEPEETSEAPDYLFLLFIVILIGLFIALAVNHYSLPEIPKY